MLFSLSRQGDAPGYLSKLNRSGSPYAGVLTSSAVTGVAVVLKFLFFGKVFLYLISVALIAGIFDWAMVRRASRHEGSDADADELRALDQCPSQVTHFSDSGPGLTRSAMNDPG